MGLKATVEKIEDVEEAFRSLYTEQDGKHILTGIDGMVPASQLAAVKTEAGGYRIKLKKADDALALFGDMDPTKTREALDRLPELEAAAAGKLDPAKMDELVAARLTTKLAPIQRERDTFAAENKALKDNVEAFTNKERMRTIGDAIRRDGRAAKVVDTALEDAIMLGERVFEVNEDGSVTAKTGVGCTPGIDPTAWFQEMQPKRAHWWGPSQGGGANGNNGRGGFGGVNPFAIDTWNVTAQGALVRSDRKKADAMAKAAGTTVGGLKPKVK